MSTTEADASPSAETESLEAGRLRRAMPWEGPLVVGCILLALILKLAIAATTIGTNDVVFLKSFANQIFESGCLAIYNSDPRFNHPPLICGWLWLLEAISGAELRRFALLVRLPAILADVGSSVLVWRLARRLYPMPSALIVSALFALCPVLVMVSGFHGNTDPVLAFLVLLAAYLLVVRRRQGLAALVLGVAMNVKIVPLLCLPAFFFWIRGWPGRVRFAAIALAGPLLGFLVHILSIPEAMLRQVFSYGGLPDVWGLRRFFPGYEYGRLLILASVLTVAVAKGRQARHPDRLPEARQRDLLESLALSFTAFYALTPGFGVQYLGWCVPFLAFLGTTVFGVYSALASLFMFRVYTYWSGGLPWNFADARIYNPHFPEPPLGLVLWAFLVLVLCWRLRPASLWRLAPSPKGRPRHPI